MGQSVMLQSLSMKCLLYKQIVESRKHASVFAYLWCSFGVPWCWSKNRPDDFEDSPEIFVESKLFHSLTEANHVVDEIVLSSRQAAEMCPGLVERRAFLDKSQRDIKGILENYFESQKEMDAAGVASNIVFGANQLGIGLRMCTPKLVIEYARLLKPITTSMINDMCKGKYCEDDLAELVNLYANAAKRCEAVLMCDGYVLPEANS